MDSSCGRVQKIVVEKLEEKTVVLRLIFVYPISGVVKIDIDTAI